MTSQSTPASVPAPPIWIGETTRLLRFSPQGRYLHALTAANRHPTDPQGCSRCILESGPATSSVSAVLVWMDLEMTGLDPSRDTILEVATLVTDDDLTIVAEGPDLVVSTPPERLEMMDDFVNAMHTRSGLLAEIAASAISLEQAGAATLEFIRAHVPTPRTVPLAGNSIGTDRRFLATQLPEIEEYLHYRSVDVSTVKELARRWYPGAMKGAPAKAGGHRAMDDIRESVAELAYYRAAIFRDTGDGPSDTSDVPPPSGDRVQ